MSGAIKIFLFLTIASFCSSQGNAQSLFVADRPGNALNGTQVVAMLTPLSLSVREDSIFQQFISGNVPQFMRNLVEVADTENVSGQNRIIRYYVIPDYVALGCDSDYFLCPMTPLLAQKIADYCSCILPTRKMVNQIWKTATVKLSPQSIPPSAQMTTVPVFDDHDSMVWNSRSAVLATHPLGELVSGDKKDVIISNQIYGHPAPGRVVIYGWHYLSGTPIQPLYYGHEETYADYSHGIRLVLSDMILDDSLVAASDVLASTTLNVLLSDEGAISVPRYPITFPAIDVPISFAVLAESNTVAVLQKNSPTCRGRKVVFSNDALHFSLPSFIEADNFSLPGFYVDSILYVRIAGMGTNGGYSSYSEVLCASTLGSNRNSEWLAVNGFDRNSVGNTHNFVRKHCPKLLRLHDATGVSSCTNEALTDSLILLSNFRAVDYILGEESSATESLSSDEQLVITDFMQNAGKLFISGSEIGWDLGHLGATADSAFYSQVLHASYVADSPDNLASNCYSFSTVFGNFSFDDGTHGTYNVDYPDVVFPSDTISAVVETIGEYDGFAGNY